MQTKKLAGGIAVVAIVLAAAWASECRAQVLAQNQAVGGVSINADGVLENATVDAIGALKALRAQSLTAPPTDLDAAVSLRKLSLKQIDEALAASIADKKELPDEMKYLAGLQRIQYVFVYPEAHDIVLVGPGEGWKLDAKGNVVGRTSGRPVMLLDDLIVALRSAKEAARGGITCSIDPTQEGLARLQAFLGQAAALSKGGNREAAVEGIESALGPQKISVTGVAGSSHFARVLVAADYRMKRIAMGFEPSPVRGLPSYMEMASASRGAVQMPRWWLEPDYQPLVKDAAGMAFELRGGSVKAMTEDEFLAAGGQRERSGKSSATAQRWADLMTQKYEPLAAAEPIFGQLRNCMELAIVGALVVKERLPEKAAQSLPTLMDSPEVKAAIYAEPKTVSSKATLMRKGNHTLVSVSGGVKINSWQIADRFENGEAPAKARSEATPSGRNWRWN